MYPRKSATHSHLNKQASHHYHQGKKIMCSSGNISEEGTCLWCEVWLCNGNLVDYWQTTCFPVWIYHKMWYAWSFYHSHTLKKDDMRRYIKKDSCLEGIFYIFYLSQCAIVSWQGIHSENSRESWEISWWSSSRILNLLIILFKYYQSKLTRDKKANGRKGKKFTVRWIRTEGKYFTI